MKNQVIIALDFSKVQVAEEFLQLWKRKEKPFIKIGYQLFYQVGPDWVARRKEEGYPIFLDLKLHDIPQTVASAVGSLKKLDVDFLTIHASGGKKMMQAAKEEARESKLRLLAVTQLTSTDQQILNEELQIDGTIEHSVVHLSKMAYQTGMDGVICSGQEVPIIKQATSFDFLAVTPGIRPLGSEVNDQKRVVTPQMAIRAGADFLVIGRPITKAVSPLDAYRKVVNEIQQQKEN